MSVLDGPGEGTWSVFAAKVVEERDALREKVSSLEAERVPDEQRPTEIRRQSARATRSMAKLAAVAKLLVANGCDCDCEHHYEDHDDDCERCFACKVSAAIGELA